MTREAVEQAIAAELVGVRARPFDLVLEEGEAVHVAKRVLDAALAAGCLLPDSLERVGDAWRSEANPDTWLCSRRGNPARDNVPAYRVIP